jgi:hypothetical protein
MLEGCADFVGVPDGVLMVDLSGVPGGVSMANNNSVQLHNSWLISWAFWLFGDCCGDGALGERTELIDVVGGGTRGVVAIMVCCRFCCKALRSNKTS